MGKLECIGQGKLEDMVVVVVQVDRANLLVLDFLVVQVVLVVLVVPLVLDLLEVLGVLGVLDFLVMELVVEVVVEVEPYNKLVNKLVRTQLGSQQNKPVDFSCLEIGVQSLHLQQQKKGGKLR